MDESKILEIMVAALSVTSAAFESVDKIPGIILALCRATAVFAKAASDPNDPSQQVKAEKYILDTITSEFKRLDVMGARELYKGVFDDAKMKGLSRELIQNARTALK